MDMRKSRVLIADDHCLFAAGMERLLAPECDVVAVVNDDQALLDGVRTLFLDVVVLDVSCFDGVSVIASLRRLDPNVRVVVVTMSDDPLMAAEAFRRGAAGYVLKNSSVTELLDAVRFAREHKSYITPLVAGGIIESLSQRNAHASDHELTSRQLEVLRLLAQGKSMKEVGNVLQLTARTVAFHKYRMMHALKIKNSAELVRFAVAQRIV